MGCEHEGGGFYRPRQPKRTPFYQLVEEFYPRFEAVYEDRYQERYGFWRPAISAAVEKFLECGDLQQGFARVRCPDCAHEFFVAYSCRGRCFCPSCLPAEASACAGLHADRSAQAGHQKRALQTAQWVSQEVCAPVPHRQFVSCLPAGRSRFPNGCGFIFGSTGGCWANCAGWLGRWCGKFMPQRAISLRRFLA